jgi:hypothetical protein
MIFIAWLTLFMTPQAHAWGKLGHRIVGEVGQLHLNVAANESCTKLLRGLSLADVSPWADDMRDNPVYAPLDELHFADLPPGVKRYEEAPRPPQGDVVFATQVLIEYIKTGDAEGLKKIPAFQKIPMDKETAVKLLAHFVADIHQPFHIFEIGQRGANVIHVKWMGREHSNLHVVWDELLVEAEKLSYSEYAQHLKRYLGRLTPEEKKNLENMNVVDWANESIALHDELLKFPDDLPTSSEVAHGAMMFPSVDSAGPSPSPDHIVGYKYISSVREIVNRRLMLAGARLGLLLNSILQ